MKDYKPPFQWFGGKSRVAATVWAALGDVPVYVEPFFGSGAVLMLRPHAGQVENVNDADGFVANFWRALRADPEAVADAADWPVNEADLHARHIWLLGQRERITDRLMGDPEWFDAKVAGWWVWGQCCWIGSGWCSGRGPWRSVDGVLVMGSAGMGVNRVRPHLGDAGMGVNRKRPHLGSAGQGVRAERRAALGKYLGELADRLRNVRVCCGDWSRICGPTPTFKMGLCGVFLDPPYADTAGRSDGLYATDCLRVAHDVREWAIEAGKRDDMRIVLAGYEGEHRMPDDWRVVAWKASGGYGRQGNGPGLENAERERLWLSPACLSLDPIDDGASLFAEVAT